jgi:hypothetical protein
MFAAVESIFFEHTIFSTPLFLNALQRNLEVINLEIFPVGSSGRLSLARSRRRVSETDLTHTCANLADILIHAGD